MPKDACCRDEREITQRLSGLIIGHGNLGTSEGHFEVIWTTDTPVDPTVQGPRKQRGPNAVP